MKRTPLKAGKPLKRGKRLRQRSDRMAEEISPADQAWSQYVRWRDDYRCMARALVPWVACVGDVAAHHIHPKEDFPALRHEVGNGISLCVAHHNWVHDGDPIKARKLELLGPFCTGVAAIWCPVHGDCTCRSRLDLNDYDCPLHGPQSDHAEP